MKKIIGLFAVLLITNPVISQNYYKEFKKYLNDGDTVNQLETLIKWKIADSTDPELFTCYFNYYFQRAKKETVTLTKERPDGGAFEMKDSLGQVSGYIGSHFYIDLYEIQKGLDIIERGIEMYPDRLDMRFGKIYVYGQIRDWENFTREIIEAVKRSGMNDNQWLWAENEKQQNGKEYFLTSLQDYQVQLYETGSDALLANMQAIANEILSYYPDDIMSLSNLSVTYLLTDEYDKALECLLRAEKLNPKDYIVLANIAHAYKLKGDKQKAIEYYEKTIQYGDEEAAADAKRQIEDLNK